MKSLLLFFYNRFALNALVSEDYLKAIKYFIKIKNLKPDLKGINYNLGLCYLGSKDFKNSEQALLSDLNNESSDAELYKTLGDLYYLWGKQNQASENYRKFSNLTDEKYVGSWLKIRLSILKSPADMTAIHNANQALENGLAFMKQKAYPQAEKAFAEATSKDPSNYQAFNNYGVLMLRQFNNPEKALAYFEKATALNPSPMYQANLHRIHKLIKDSK